MQDTEVSCATITCHVLKIWHLNWLQYSKDNKICAVFVNPVDFAGNALPIRMDCCRIRDFVLRGDIGLISSGDVSLRRIQFQMNEAYSQVAYEMIEIWHQAYCVSLTTSDPDTRC